MKIQLIIVGLVLIAMSGAGGWFVGRWQTSQQWEEAYTAQMEEAGKLQEAYLSAWKATQSWPEAESLAATSSLTFNGSTLAGPARIDRYLAGVSKNLRIDFVLRPGGELAVQCRKRQL